jgi:macrolide-specific efflux system membrane fusion protein
MTSRFSRLSRPAIAAALVLAIAAGAWSQYEPAPPPATQPVARADIEATVMAVGTLQPRSFVDIGAQVSGQVLRIHVEPGASVEKGALLVEIDPSVQKATVDAGRAALAGLNAQLAEREAQRRLARQQHERQRLLAEANAARGEDVQTAEASLAVAVARIADLEAQIAQTQATLTADVARLGYTRIYAPMSGTVVSVDAREGQTLNATYQTPNILRIADLSSMTVWTEVSEADVRRVKPGMPVYFSTLGGDGRRWHGTVRQLLPAPPAGGARPEGTALAPSSAKVVLYTALFDVGNPDGALMPQMTAQVSFVTASARNALAVPLPALSAVDGKPGRFTARVLAADGRIAERDVEIGVRNRLQAEVLRGLAEGERLVTDAVDDGAGVRL